MRHEARSWQHIGVAVAIGLAAAGGVAGCERDARRADADNTARNVRDAEQRTATPLDQGGSEGDRTITQHIRKVVVGNDRLSTNAHNVKIITQDGVVTLRGPVETDQEKTTVLAAAQGAPGVIRVDNQLDVETSN